ncbi:MAG: hypothetical protein AAF621_07045 [Pseudomonadota bacterium]
MELTTYEDWKHCITELCNIALTPEYIESRIADLNDVNNYQTQKFTSIWGEAHLKRTIGWFEQARQELKS